MTTAKTGSFRVEDFESIVSNMKFLKATNTPSAISHILNLGNGFRVEMHKDEQGEPIATVSVTQPMDPVLGGYRDR